jgi:hypothetical protein
VNRQEPLVTDRIGSSLGSTSPRCKKNANPFVIGVNWGDTFVYCVSVLKLLSLGQEI